jgi:hypothetical protein
MRNPIAENSLSKTAVLAAAIVAYSTYYLALEIWCWVYGLIY